MLLTLVAAADAGAAGETPVGAVIRDALGWTLASAGNACLAVGDPTAHAELQALRQAARRIQRQRLPGCTLYVSLEPCPLCQAAMESFRVEHALYLASRPPEALEARRPTPTRRMGCSETSDSPDSPPLSPAAGALLTIFFESLRQHC
ncbi:MAG: nucleoside deaminase [Magnetococcales bacterium]|nr:nucleoside deaminase [Magnetococcales bacterium]